MSQMANSFHESNYQVDLLLVKAKGPFLKDVSPSVNIIDFNLHSPYFAFPKLIAYLRHENPETLVSTMELSNIIFLLCKRISGAKTTSIIRIANTVSKHYRIYYKKWLERILLRFIYPWADHIIAVSNGVADDLCDFANLPKNSIQTIYNPVISSELIQNAKQPVDHPWFKPGMPPIILGAGRLTKQKNFARLIHAFEMVHSEMGANLLILGTGEEKEKLKSLVSALQLDDNVELAGFVSNPYAYMANVSVFVLSSDWEGLSTVLIEAMACGCPLVATDSPSGPDEVLAGDKYGHLVPLDDIDALAQAILAVLSGDTRPADPTWLEQFSFERGFKKHLEIVEG